MVPVQVLLCGVDAASGQDYSHRRDWIVERLELLGRLFAGVFSGQATCTGLDMLPDEMDASPFSRRRNAPNW